MFDLFVNLMHISTCSQPPTSVRQASTIVTRTPSVSTQKRATDASARKDGKERDPSRTRTPQEPTDVNVSVSGYLTLSIYVCL